MPAQGIEQLRKKLLVLHQSIQVRIPKLVAADAERFFKESFRLQGWRDAGMRPWVRTKGGKAGRILKRTGLLMNSVRVEAVGTRIIASAGGSNIPYARIHNEGGTIEGTFQVRAHQRKAHLARTRRGRITRKEAAVKAHERKVLTYMPRRQFMGPSKQLEAVWKSTIERELQRSFPR